MYIHIGSNLSVRGDDIIGIFDMDNTTVTRITRDYLTHAEKSGKVVYAGAELPKTFIAAVEKDGSSLVYISPISAITLVKRAERKNIN